MNIRLLFERFKTKTKDVLRGLRSEIVYMIFPSKETLKSTVLKVFFLGLFFVCFIILCDLLAVFIFKNLLGYHGK